ncbi:hypothetical protein [Mycobacterium sp. SMC-2]|nr:hypothetical protein [Mycobacterium sp. SMC-2]
MTDRLPKARSRRSTHAHLAIAVAVGIAGTVAAVWWVRKCGSTIR